MTEAFQWWEMLYEAANITWEMLSRRAYSTSRCNSTTLLLRRVQLQLLKRQGPIVTAANAVQALSSQS